MKEHLFREMVNAARDIALKYHDHQSLRDRMARTLSPFVYGDKPVTLKKPVASSD